MHHIVTCLHAGPTVCVCSRYLYLPGSFEKPLTRRGEKVGLKSTLFVFQSHRDNYPLLPLSILRLDLLLWIPVQLVVHHLKRRIFISSSPETGWKDISKKIQRKNVCFSQQNYFLFPPTEKSCLPSSSACGSPFCGAGGSSYRK